ncbi:trigger factor [Paenibacillus baekrokdamisoli]|uniref:Trigger factor n=1 Tax=Paenibacillus baekrokdamisoli TaxID=1712516 RepID=A0A3G9J617_9BACL|nr:trigger factor [Paenibacillus baekrokdamisoli]MBB3067625.1 trigger factor [Paenibacillus baekrokdamisoli]BBH19188.1 trigger factor [Paenibacillus baekrokdamisoli]
MTATWEKIDKNLVSIEVEVAAEKVNEAIDKAFKKVVAKVNVPGFRKGKVPRGIFEARFGIESLYQDAIDILLPDAYSEALQETGILPVDRPDIDVDQFGKGQSFKFKAKVTVKPEVQLGDYKGLEVPAADASVSEEEVAAELDRLQQRHAELTVIEEGAAENGDVTVIDFDGYVDGEAFEGGKSERHSLELGSGSFIPGFEEQVVGLQTGDFKDIEVTFPESYHAENLAGKQAIFKVKLHEIKRKNLPALDDEFAKDVSEFDTLEEFKQDLVSKLADRKLKESEAARETAVVEKASEAAEIDIPDAMIDSETNFMLRDFENRLKQQGMNLELYFQFSGQDEAALRSQMHGDAVKRVRNNLVLEQIAKTEGITADDSDLNEELENLSKQYGRSVEELRTIFEGNGNLDNIKEDLVLRKTIKFLLENSKAETVVA